MLQTEYKFGKVYTLADQVETAADKVQFKGIFGNDNGGVALLGFKAGQVLDTHLAPAELMVTVLEGEINFTMLDHTERIAAGQYMLVGQGVAHSVAALTDAKIMLTKVKSEK